jgi:hypothetical protein
MILPFSTQLNGKPTYFVERIHKGIRENYMLAPVDPSVHYPPNYNFVAKDKLPAKLHTIREDKNDRWNVGTKIDFFINARQKNMFRFAPVLPVVSVQKVFMTYAFNDVIEISVNDKYINDVLAFAKNDGFDKWEDFFNFFYPKIMENPEQFYKAKLIHWTDFKY